MANIDWGTLALGAVVGMGCRKQLKAASRIAANTAASLASAAAAAVGEVAKETAEKPTAEQAAEDYLERVNRKIDEALAGTPLQQQQAGQGNGKKGH